MREKLQMQKYPNKSKSYKGVKLRGLCIIQ